MCDSTQASLYHGNISKHVDTVIIFSKLTLTLIYPAHFEDVQCQSGVNHIYEG